MMVIASVSAVGFSVNPSKSENKKVTNPIEMQKQDTQYNPEAGALRSYFEGGQAISFKGFGCSTGNFITKKIDDVPCCCCGGRMVRSAQMDKKAQEFSGIRGEKLVQKLNEDKDFFRTPQRVIVMLAAKEAEKNPSLDFAGATRAAGRGLKEKTQDYCVESLREASIAAQAAFGNDRNPVSSLIQREIEKIQGGKIERMPFTESLVRMEDQIDPVTYEKIMNCAMNIPSSFKDVTKAMSSAQGNSTGVARGLLKPSMQTIEHVHPKSKGGPNATQNFLAECGDCNHPRGNMSYSQWLKVHPEYPLKAQDHIEYFQQQIVDGVIPSEYDDYGTDIRETLSKESNGRMVLKVLDQDKIRELREQKRAGKDVDVADEIAKIYGEEKAEEAA